MHNENVSGAAVLWRHNKSKMADGRYFEDREITIPRWKSSDFDKIRYTTADIEPNDSHVTKNWNS